MHIKELNAMALSRSGIAGIQLRLLQLPDFATKVPHARAASSVTCNDKVISVAKAPDATTSMYERDGGRASSRTSAH